LKTPPFWIDMSKLFELYVLGLLKDSLGNEIEFQFPANYGNPDFLFPARKLIIDAKYKTYYGENFKGQTPWKREQIAKDIRQLSGYARDKKVLERLGNDNRDTVECLIIYPYKDSKNQADTCFNTLEIENKKEIEEFNGFYKLAVRLPVIKTN
jgi:5-methylcytosine-specific restriction enzyme subunit McrC